MKKSNIGVIGLAVMGENLALNMEGKGFQVSLYNRIHGIEHEVVDLFMNGRGVGKHFLGFKSIQKFVESLELPRRIFMMVRAGHPVDELIEQLIPFLDSGDVLIDGGNSNYEDTERRVKYLESKDLLFVGSGVSGGEEGALNGPSIMPGGSEAAWPLVKPILQAIAAKAEDGTPCCDWVGKGGAGHFVKMVHNGIEYGDMQLIAEAYLIMREYLGLKNHEMAAIFNKWNKDKLNSYLIAITREILEHRNSKGEYLIDKILDTAGQKGTGKWSVVNALEYSQPLNLIATAVFERIISSQKEMRMKASNVFNNASGSCDEEIECVVDALEQTLYASKLVSYAQGFALMKAASDAMGWNLNLSLIAKLWRNGCIIRSAFLDSIANAYERNPQLEHLLLDPYFVIEIEAARDGWKETIARAALQEIAIPAFSSALNYFYSLTTANLPANLLQAQRDYFGAHTFERVDNPRGNFFHENWTGKGGETMSGSYNV